VEAALNLEIMKEERHQTGLRHKIQGESPRSEKKQKEKAHAK